MISECVVVASCMMLTAAQLQFPFPLPNVQPIQITTLPNSQALMTQRAHAILNQDASEPIAPGVLGGVPVLVSEAAQSILDQESRIVGYNVPEGLQSVFQQQQPFFQQFSSVNQQLEFLNGKSPQVVPVTHKTAVRQSDRPRLQVKPQSITIPLLKNNGRQQSPTSQRNVVPVRAMVSLKNLLTSRSPSSSESVSINENQGVRQSVNSQEYFDIPPNHPVPGPTSAPHQPADQSSSTRPELYSSDDHIVNMRPPPPTQFESFYRAEENTAKPQDERNYRQNNRPSPSPPSKYSKEEKRSNASQERKKSKQHSSKSSSGSTTERITTFSRSKHRVQDNKKSSYTKDVNKDLQHSDSAGEFSENSFSTTLLRPPPHSSPTYYDNRNNIYQGQSQGYSSNDINRPIVHKHIFVHAAPEGYSQGPRVRVIRPPVNQEKHVQIIFVKSPTEAPPTETIVEIPPVESPKTVVYVLSKKPQEGGGQVKVINPPARKPHAPEIYFIRYGDKRQNQGYPVPDLHSLNLNENNSGYGSERHQQFLAPPPGPYNPGLLSYPRQKRNRDYGLDVYAPLMAYANTGQINEITQDEAILRNSNLDSFF